MKACRLVTVHGVWMKGKVSGFVDVVRAFDCSVGKRQCLL